MTTTISPRLARTALAVALSLSASLAPAQSPAERPQEAWWLRGPDAPVQIRPDAKVTPSQRERLQRHADLGLDALRRYVWVMRGMRNWQLKDLVGPSGDA